MRQRFYTPRERGGENASSIRGMVIQYLGLFGFKLDPERNAIHVAQNNECVTQDGDPIVMPCSD
jgi:acetate kinase